MATCGMSDPSRYTDEIVISWPELHRDARYLSQELHGLGSWKGIIAITRGGLVPAALVAARWTEIGCRAPRVSIATSPTGRFPR